MIANLDFLAIVFLKQSSHVLTDFIESVKLLIILKEHI